MRAAHEPRPVSLGELIHEHVRRAIELAVAEELGRTSGTARAGAIAMAMVPRYTRRAPEVNAAVVATYLAGTNTRRIRGALASLLNRAPLSKSAGSRVVATLRESLHAWMSRSLADVDGIVLYLDAIALRVRSAGRVVSLPVLGAIGVLPDGRKQLLALECCGGESAAAWRGFVEDLARRGLAAPVLCIIDGNPGLRRAIGEIWPTALVQRDTTVVEMLTTRG